MSLQKKLALDELASHLCEFLPKTRPPLADQRLSFFGIVTELGLQRYWREGSKLTAIRYLLEGVLDGGTGKFSPLIEKIVERSHTYRLSNKKPLTREDVEVLNRILLKVSFRIPALYDAALLDSLPRGVSQASNTASVGIDVSKLKLLQEKLLRLSNLKAQQRGFAFETFLSSLFELNGLLPRQSFRLMGEQIDGSFQLGQEVYLLEAKWQDRPIGQADLLAFAGKVDGKATGALGLFVSYSTFSQDGLEAFARGKRTSIICMDSLDLYHILEGKLRLSDVIARKRRYALETNAAYVPVRDLFTGMI